MMSSHKWILKLFISLLLVGVVLYTVNFHQLLETLEQISLLTVFVVVFAYLFGQMLSALKWWIIARSAGGPARFPAALKAYFIGMFVNCFGLGIIGGDVARGVLFARPDWSVSRSIATVGIDRIHGLGILALIAISAAVFSGAAARLDRTLMYILVSIIILTIVIWMLFPVAIRWLEEKISVESRFRSWIENLHGVFPTRWQTLITISIISFFFHLIQIGIHQAVANDFEQSIPLYYLFVAIPFVNILSSLPISWNGLGVREAAYIYFLSGIILTKEQCIVLGAIWILAVTTTSAIGGVIAFLTGSDLSLKSQQEASV